MIIPNELYACLYVSDLPAQSFLRLNPEFNNQPCVVLDGELPMQQICSLNSIARGCGLQNGMTCAEIGTFSGIIVCPRELHAEQAARMLLLKCAATFSPRIEECSKDTDFLCCIDITGTDNLFGPPNQLANKLHSCMNTLGFKASVAISHNFYVAIYLAKSLSSQNSFRVIATGEETAVLEHLPLSVLDLTEQQIETFMLWGIHTLGILAALPEKELAARIDNGRCLREMARGEFPHLFRPINTPVVLEQKVDLDTPVEMLGSLLFVIGVMLDRLLDCAKGHLLVLASVSVTLSLRDNTMHKRTVRPAVPTDDKQIWINLLHLDLEAHSPQAAIVAVALEAEPGETSKIQLGIFSPQMPDETRIDVTLGRISAIVGENNVGRAVLKDTHAQDSFRLEPFFVSNSKSAMPIPRQQRTVVRQLRPPESVSVTLHSSRPAAFFFRDRRYTVERAYGPWLDEGDWWAPTLWRFEQWDLIAHARDGSLLCCCITYDLMCDQWQMASLYD